MALSAAETSHDHTPLTYRAELHCGSYGHFNFIITGPNLSMPSTCPDWIVDFDQDVKLDIPEEGVVLESGWSITPLGTTVISPRQLRSNLRELCCILRVQWTKPKEAPVELCHRINLLGAKPPRNFILLTIERPSQPSLESLQSSSSNKRKRSAGEKATPAAKYQKKQPATRKGTTSVTRSQKKQPATRKGTTSVTRSQKKQPATRKGTTSVTRSQKKRPTSQKKQKKH